MNAKSKPNRRPPPAAARPARDRSADPAAPKPIDPIAAPDALPTPERIERENDLA